MLNCLHDVNKKRNHTYHLNRLQRDLIKEEILSTNDTLYYTSSPNNKNNKNNSFLVQLIKKMNRMELFHSDLNFDDLCELIN